MKKITLFIVTLMFSIVAFAQSIDFKKDGDYYYLVSPNARYYAGSQQGAAAYLFDADTKEVVSFSPVGELGFKANAISNTGVVAGSSEFKAVLMNADGSFDYLPMPDGLTELEENTNDAVAISPDGKQVVVAFNADAPKTYFVYTMNENGLYDMVKLPMPEKDPIYGMYAQWIAVKDMSADGNTLVGLFLTDDGMRQLPLIWRNVNGEWTCEFFGTEVCLKEGKTIPPYPYDEMIVDADGDASLPYDVWEEWTTAQYEAETGYYYQLKGSMMSANANYVALSVAIQLEGEEYATMYGATYDLVADSLVLFSSMSNATSLSVNNEGEVIVATPAMEEFRWAYVISVAEPTKPQTLTDWVKAHTNGAIDLAQYMKYELQTGETVAEGTAYWAKEGNGLVTFQLNILGTGLYESYFLRFDVPASNRPVYNGEFGVYPNPTTGVLNMTKAMTSVEVYDVIGRKVYAQSNVEQRVDLSELQAGQYILVGEVDGVKYSTKIMIKK